MLLPVPGGVLLGAGQKGDGTDGSLSCGKGRWACMSVRRMFARTRESPGSDFLRETGWRSGSRAATIGLIAKTLARLPVGKTAASRPREVSSATGIGFFFRATVLGERAQQSAGSQAPQRPRALSLQENGHGRARLCQVRGRWVMVSR